jgi:hypothetical protein
MDTALRSLPLAGTPDATDPATRRLLRPGCPVLRRDDDTVQVGLAPGSFVRLPRRPAVLDLLTALQEGRPVRSLSADAAAAFDALLAADLVVSPPTGQDRPGLRPALAQFGSSAVARDRRRSTHRVGIVADRPARGLLDDLLVDADLRHDDDRATMWLVVAPGILSRAAVDPFQRAGTPHLVVDGLQGTRRVGPFVEPGRTACLRCVDAHHAAADPRLPLLLEQAARAPAGSEPVDPLLDRLALAWAVRDLARYAEGEAPSTWSATVTVGPVDAPSPVRWLRHPDCGCSWDGLCDLP